MRYITEDNSIPVPKDFNAWARSDHVGASILMEWVEGAET
jgi:hypothetical protein